MTLAEYVQKQIEGTTETRTAYIRKFSEKCGVSTVTLTQVYRGAKLNRFDKAKAISSATDGEVSILDLCE